MASPSLRRSATIYAFAGVLGLGSLGSGVSVAAEPSADDRARAQAEYESASRNFAAQRYLEAAQELERAYAHDPKLNYLYQRGHALRLAGSCAAAVVVFSDVAQRVKTTEQRQEVEQWIERCQQVLDASGVASPRAETSGVEAEPVDAEGPSEPATPRPPSGPRPRSDLAAGLTMGLGSAAAGAGIALLVTSAVTARGAPPRETEPEYEARVQRTRALEIGGAIVLGAGAMAMTAAVVRYAVLRRRYVRSARVAVRGGVFYF